MNTKQYKQSWYARNRERCQAYQRKWVAAHPLTDEQKRERSIYYKQWLAAHPNYHHDYYHRNKPATHK